MTETPFSELLIPATWEESRPKRKVSGPKPLIRYCSVTELATQFPKCHPRIGDLVTAAQDVQRCAQYLIFLSSGISALSAYLDWAVELGMLGDEAVEIIINKQGKDAQKSSLTTSKQTCWMQLRVFVLKISVKDLQTNFSNR